MSLPVLDNYFVSIFSVSYTQDDDCEQVQTESLIYSDLRSCVYKSKNKYKPTDKALLTDSQEYKIMICGNYCDIKKGQYVDIIDPCGSYIGRYLIDDMRIYPDFECLEGHVELFVSYCSDEV